MKEIYKNFGFIIVFLVSVMIFQELFGDKAARGFLAVTLLSMLIINAKDFANFAKKIVQ